MSPFEFVFSLLGLLLGLSLVEVLGGLARTLETRLRLSRRQQQDRGFRIGLLTPLLGVFLMLDLISFWRAAWIARDHLPATGTGLFSGLLFTGSYYMAAHLVFPREIESEPDLDAHYFRVRRIVLATVLGLLALQMGLWFSVPELAAYFDKMPSLWMKLGLFATLLIAALLAPGKRLNLLLLVLLVGYYLFDYVTF
jgi:hypothetical protein